MQSQIENSKELISNDNEKSLGLGVINYYCNGFYFGVLLFFLEIIGLNIFNNYYLNKNIFHINLIAFLFCITLGIIDYFRLSNVKAKHIVALFLQLFHFVVFYNFFYILKIEISISFFSIYIIFASTLFPFKGFIVYNTTFFILMSTVIAFYNYHSLVFYQGYSWSFLISSFFLQKNIVLFINWFVSYWSLSLILIIYMYFFQKRVLKWQEKSKLLNIFKKKDVFSLNELYKRAYYDFLTGVYNRLMMEDRIKVMIANAKRNYKSIAIFFIDLDNFKILNDKRGHRIGDHCLAKMATIISKTFVKQNVIDKFTSHRGFVARLGGDEFVVISNKIKYKDVENICQKAVEKCQISYPDFNENPNIHVSVTIGAYFCDLAKNNFHQKSIDEIRGLLLKYSDINMYKAKEKEKGTFYISSNS